MTQKDDLILSVKHLVVKFKTKTGVVNAVRDISFSIYRGEIVGLIGESGSGKSVTVKSIVRFNDNDTLSAQEIKLCGIDLLKLTRSWFSFRKAKYNNTRKMKKVRGVYVAYIPQDPMTSLNPSMKVGKQIYEAIKISQARKYKIALNKLRDDQRKGLGKGIDYNALVAKLKKEYKENTNPVHIKKRIFQLLDFIGINDIANNVNKYPNSFSGGMRQRIVIAITIACEPDLIIADEPTTALDVIVQAKVISLIKRLRDELNISIMFISHNIALVANLCDYIYVMYAGKIIEQGTLHDIFIEPRHPYTWALIESIPDPQIKGDLAFIPGTPPNMTLPVHGDAFAPRNKYALKIDFEKEPPLFKLSNTHKAATWLVYDDAPKVPIPEGVKQKVEIARKAVWLKINGDDTDNESQAPSTTERDNK